MKYQTIGLILLAAVLLAVGAYAFSAPTVPQQNMEPAAAAPATLQSAIVVTDGGVPVEIGIEDAAIYHATMEAEEGGTPVPEQPDVDPCCAWMYRSLSAGIRALWGDTIPERSDIGVTSNLVSRGALHTGWCVTGTGPGMDAASAGRLVLLKPDGTELTDYSHEVRCKIAKNRTDGNYRIVVTRISTGESATVSLREDVFPDRFFELFTKTKTDPSVTKEEVAEFKTVKDRFRDNLVQMPDGELFTVTTTG